MNMVQRGLQMARDKLKQHAGDSFVFVRGSCESQPFTAVKTSTTVDVLDETGALVGRVRKIELLVDPRDLVLDGKTVVPRDDDRFFELSGATRIAAYKVSSPSDNEPPWIGTDPHDTMLRTYTVLDRLA